MIPAFSHNVYELLGSERDTMNSHNPKPEMSYHKTPAASKERIAAAKVLTSSLVVQAELSLDDDFDLGTDPYNSTGQHVVLSQKVRKD